MSAADRQVRVRIELMAPIPVGHHVTVYALEQRQEHFVAPTSWEPSPHSIACDDDAHIVYTDRFVGDEALSYGHLKLPEDHRYRISLEPPIRGRVMACTVRTDRGDGILNTTTLQIELDLEGYR